MSYDVQGSDRLLYSDDLAIRTEPQQRSGQDCLQRDSLSPDLSKQNCVRRDCEKRGLPKQQQERIPKVYKFWHFYIEPAISLGGAYKLLYTPADYFAYMPATSVYDPGAQLIYSQLAACYVMFAVLEAFVLRVCGRDDESVWRAFMVALLVCDAGHLFASWQEMGNEGFWCPWVWSRGDAVTMVLTVVPAVLRVGVLARWGFERGKRR